MHNTLIARISKDGFKREQSLREHIKGTEDIAVRSVYNPIVKACVSLAALLHDLGKSTNRFQLRVRGDNIRTRHAFLGSVYLNQKLGKNPSKYIDSIQYMIEGHHSGLKNVEDYDSNISAALMEFDNSWTTLESFIDKFFHHTNLENEVEDAIQNILKYDAPLSMLDIDVITRLGISALKVGDTTNSAEFENGKKKKRERYSSFSVDTFIENLNSKYKELKEDTIRKGKENSLVNILRNRAKSEVSKHLQVKRGFYMLNLPTGLGKTLLSIYWALHHAKNNDMRKIIYVLPFNTISDEIGRILIEIFGKRSVLIDHSGSSKPGENDPFFVERWDAPIIITSNVQFFETLFASHSKLIAKYYNIQRSIVIFDEFQAFPKNLMEPTSVMLQKVQEYLECSFLYSTATMPWVESTYSIQGIDYISSLIKNSNYYYKRLVRVSWSRIENPLTTKDIAGIISLEKESTLCIVNTKRNALRVYKHLVKHSKSKDVYIFHLSGNMIYDDRKRILGKIKDLLKEKKLVKLVSTQLIEAGIDIDFPVVYRSEAPFESLIQSAGRCNREGHLDKGKMVIFKLEKDFVNTDYENQANYTHKCISKDNGKLDTSLFTTVDGYRTYSRKVIGRTEQDNSITESREKLNFGHVSDQYKIIPDNTIPVFIYSGKKRKKIFDAIVEELKKNNKLSRASRRILRKNSISLYRTNVTGTRNNVYKEWIRCMVVGEHSGEDNEKSYAEQLYYWVGKYSSNTGIAYRERTVTSSGDSGTELPE